MPWEIKQVAKAKIQNPILIEGLPGMGNVGKIAVDFLIDALKAKKIYELFSYDLPHCVFVNEENVVELPSIEIYHKTIKNRSILLLAGDIQPISESSCYEFCNKILDTFQIHKGRGKEVITLGGIALPRIPRDPQVYCTGTSKSVVNRYRSLVNTNMHGVVGPIVGVSGLLTGLAGKRNIPAVTLLAETFGHPSYLGIKGARKLLNVLQKQLNISLDLSELDDDILELEKSLLTKVAKSSEVAKAITKKKSKLPFPQHEIDYIG